MIGRPDGSECSETRSREAVARLPDRLARPRPHLTQIKGKGKNHPASLLGVLASLARYSRALRACLGVNASGEEPPVCARSPASFPWTTLPTGVTIAGNHTYRLRRCETSHRGECS